MVRTVPALQLDERPPAGGLNATVPGPRVAMASSNVITTSAAGSTPLTPSWGTVDVTAGGVESMTGTSSASAPVAPGGSTTSMRTVTSVASIIGTGQSKKVAPNKGPAIGPELTDD